MTRTEAATMRSILRKLQEHIDRVEEACQDMQDAVRGDLQCANDYMVILDAMATEALRK